MSNHTHKRSTVAITLSLCVCVCVWFRVNQVLLVPLVTMVSPEQTARLAHLVSRDPMVAPETRDTLAPPAPLEHL